MRRQSATYTRAPVNYLSLTELAVSVAQVAHVLTEAYVDSSPCVSRYASLLPDARLQHELRFVTFEARFRTPVADDVYELSCEVLRPILIDRFAGLKFRFSVGRHVTGLTLCALSHASEKRP